MHDDRMTSPEATGDVVGQSEPVQPHAPSKSPLHQHLLHDSALKHVSGEARYTDDLPNIAGTLVAQVVVSAHAHARILKLDTTVAEAMPGISCVLTHRDIKGENNVGPVI